MSDQNETPEENFEVVTDEAVGSEVETKEPESKDEESAPSATDSDEGKKPESKPADNASDEKPKRSFQKRIDRLTKRAADAERRAEEAERKASEGDKSKNDEPDPSDFDDYDDYLEAKAKHDKPEKKDAPKDQPKEDKPSQEFVDAFEDVQDSFDEWRSKHSDFDDVIGADDVSITEDMVIAMSEADDPGAIAYHLGKNKNEASRIAKLSPIRQGREIGKLEAKLSAEPVKPTKKTTQAPAPIDPVGGKSEPKTNVGDLAYDEYEATMNAKENKGKKGFW